VTDGLAAAEPGAVGGLGAPWLDSGGLGPAWLGATGRGSVGSPGGSFRIGVGAGFAGPHETCGSVPATKAIITG